MKQSVDKIWQFLQRSRNQSLDASDGQSETSFDQSAGSCFPRSREQLESLDYPPLPTTQDGIIKSAPIMIVRKFRSSTRRLYKDPGRDIINQHILSEDVAIKLVAEFIKRLGHVIQIRSVADLTSAPNIRQASPLLYAVCCLHGLRFCKDPDLVNTSVHRQLYEEVRDMLGQVVLASPIPFEELYAVLIMSIFEAAPRPVFEYIESWLLSGICAQQAISTIDFAEIMTNLRRGRHKSTDKRSLSLWNNICLVNLRFAVGTGKPTTIPSELLDQCPAILNHPEATLDDGIVLAEILLFSALCNKHFPPSLDRDGNCPELTAWEKRWKHLLLSEKTVSLRFCREFAYLVLAMRSVDKYRTEALDQSIIRPDQTSASGTVPPSGGHISDNRARLNFLYDSSQAYAHDHALLLAKTFLEMPTALVQELPKFHHICIAYCTLVLSEFIDKAHFPREPIFETLNDVVAHYHQFSEEIPAVMNVAIEKVKLSLNRDFAFERKRQSQIDDQDPSHDESTSKRLHIQPINASADAHRLDANPSANSVEVGRDFVMEEFDPETDLFSFPTVEDFFGNWMLDFGGEYPDHPIQG
ncbi:hypothetical protein A1O1_06945 [Capronia coronata CBS 617.96]|uniref:Transcription factor domain-containing protein n=1 Tax=Capronia coronata CBS 617.96 TaxID=1182541 RepID=W9YM41_9EURO|nr:uncharacterized protein A1O1_06945 [Capronia coronata CBS 617.96]EXJ83324.1 hypothetical protein A1O1_06945 [Capronia coronata CBS 617.96]